MGMIQQQVATFFAKYPQRTYKKGEVLIFAHMDLSTVFYLEQGTVIQYDITPSGDRSVLNTYKKGAFFPMSNAINTIDTPYFFEADEDVSVRCAPARETVSFVRSHPDVMFDLLSRTYRGTDGLLLRMSELMHGDAMSQVLREIWILAERFGTERAAKGRKLIRRVSEAQLAERTGLARETVSRAIVRLKNGGILSNEHGHLVLLNRDDL